MSHNSTSRFSDRVEAYRKYRPNYPTEIIDALELGANMTIADMGAGTGIFTEHLAGHAKKLYAVEPNKDMGAVMEELFKKDDHVSILYETAETTSIPDQSVDLICCAQAFHWLDPTATRAEWSRILKENGRVAIMWNERDIESSAFAREYEALIHRHATDYSTINHMQFGLDQMQAFFAPKTVNQHTFLNYQKLDLAGFIGRLFSSSYIPNQPESLVKEINREMTTLFEKHQESGLVTITYQTQLYLADAW